MPIDAIAIIGIILALAISVLLAIFGPTYCYICGDWQRKTHCDKCVKRLTSS